MLAITARLFDENGKLVGYAVTDGQQTKQLSRIDTWSYAKQKMIMNVTASGDVNDPTISGTNGFELKKLPEIKATKPEAKPFTTQTLDAIILRNLISGKLDTSKDFKEIREQAKQQLREEVTSGKLDKYRLGCLSDSIIVKNVLVFNTTTNVAVGYRIEYTGQEPINTYRMSPIDKQMEAFTIQPNTVVNLNRVETAILASLPEVSCKFNKSKLAFTLKGISGADLYETLNKFFIFYDEGGISDKCIDIYSVEKPDIIDKYFKPGNERAQAGENTTKQLAKERAAQQKQAINNATGIKGLMGAFKR